MLHNEYDGDEVQQTGRIDHQMPYEVKIRMLRFTVEKSADGIHDAAADDEDQKSRGCL